MKFKATEEKLKILSYMVEQSTEGMALADLKGNIIFSNMAWCKMHGYESPKDCSGKSLEIFHNKERLENDVIPFNKEVKKQGTYSGEVGHITKEGKIFPILMTTTLLKDPKGNPFALAGIAKDITEQVKTENELRASKEKYRLISENTGDCIWQMTLDLEFTYINQAVFPLFGYTPEDWIGSKLSDHCSSKEMEKMLAIILDGFADLPDKTTEIFETSIYHKNGEEIPCEITGKIILDDAENPIYIQGSTRDITERKKAEKDLKESKEKLSQAVQGNSIPTLIIDTDHIITHWNHACEKLTGFLEAEMVGTKKQWQVCYDQERPILADFIVDGASDEVINRYYKRKYHKSILVEGAYESEQFFSDFGEKGKWIFSSASPLRDPNGNIMGAIETFQDITERKSTEAQLRQAQKMETIGTLAGGIAHDFNNILFPILGHADMLLMDIPEDSPFRNGVNEIYTSALRAKDLVKQILTFSRQDATELILMKMQPIVKEALNLIRSTIPTTIDIKQDIESDCGAIKAAPTQLHQIVMNLTTNAYHAMEDAGGELSVSLKEIDLGEYDVISPDMLPGAYACLTVADTGVGMDKNVTEKIFDPFFTTKEPGKGTGMGLSVVHGIVKSLGGAVQVYSEPGKGTKFHVYFPVEKSSFEKQSIQTKEPVRGGTERILLVDDEDVIVTMEKQILERLGYQVTSRTSSLEALEAFRANPDRFDLVITDMAMPNMAGDKLSVELIKIRSDIPVLLCTGFSETISEEKATSLGIKGFILKPIVAQDLAKKIREILDNKSEKTN
ncbi:PAS domain-containing sensor histidine kinase [Desulfobacula sp.]|uniref:PAS domain-containing hybrid sensor histidine kinase/response regulator n=1 Tax=Desulfobacula sp. TaxID=2593537 RepID=UPI0025C071A0|nr:PAS domain-containing sensor histidine kinase [Desulfobacula sp.]MBC2704896.1 PAS domain S-box protein [Desulfobacula sp.]